MGIFQILMFAATLFFAYQIYRHVQNLEDGGLFKNQHVGEEESSLPALNVLVEAADEAYERGDITGAKASLLKASEYDGNNPEILNKLAFVTAKSGDLPEAVKLYTHSLMIDPRDDLTHNAIASLYRLQGNFALAQEHYEKALGIDSLYPQTYYNYGNLLSDMGDTRKAEEMYRRALDLQRDFPEAHEALMALEGRA